MLNTDREGGVPKYKMFKNGGSSLRQYQVTVCRFGTVFVEANSEQEAKEKATALSPSDLQWYGDGDGKQPFWVTYAELIE